METVVAREALTYAGIEHPRGAVFEATDEDARILCLIGKADRWSAETLTDDAAASSTGEGVASPKRRYRRKDLVAE